MPNNKNMAKVSTKSKPKVKLKYNQAKTITGVKSKGDGVKGRALAFAVMDAASRGETPSKAELMRRAGYSDASVNNLTKGWTSRGFREAMAESGLGVGSIKKVIEDAMNARAVVTFQGDAKETDAPDHAIRLRATDLAAKYTGLDVQRTQNLNVNVDMQLDDAIDSFGL